METIAMTEARWKLRDIVDRACAGGDATLLKRNGKIVAAIISYEDFQTVEPALLELHQDALAASR